MFISKIFKKAAKPESAQSILADNKAEKIQKDHLSDVLAKSMTRQITPFGTLYW